jgi:hypothetical protein
MAKTPDQIRKELKQIADLYDELGKKNPFKGADPAQIARSEAETQKLADALSGVREQVDRINQSFGDLYTQLKNTTAEIGKVKTPAQEMEAAFKGSLTQVKKLVDEERGLTELTIKDLKNIQERAKIKAADAKAAAESLVRENGLMDGLQKTASGYIDKRRKGYKELSDAEKTAIGLLEGQDTTLDDINNKIKKRIEQEEKINEALGLGGGILKGTAKVLDKLGLGGLANKLGLDEANKKMKELAEKRLKQVNEETGEVTYRAATLNDKFATLNVGISTMGANLAKNAVDPLAIIGGLAKKFVSAIKNADKGIGDIAKGMNMSYNEATKFAGELNNAAIQSGSYKVNTKSLIEANLAINKSLGTSVKLNNKNLQTFVELKNAAGFTNEELLGINSLAVATGGNLKDMTGEFMAQAKITATQNKAVLNEKDLLKEIDKISAATTLSLGKNPAAIAEAIATAKSLGLELGKVEDIAGSLLEFESSIEKELEAELLLGKNINLEKARQAALENDLATVAQEIAKQAGSAAEFANMNRIQQEAIAGAVGMSREELAKSLFMQEQIGNLSGEDYKLREKQINELEAKGLSQEEIKKELAAQSIDDLKHQASMADRMHEASEKINDAFGLMAIQLMPVFDFFTGIVTALTESKFLVGAIITSLIAMKAVSAAIAIKTMTIAVAKMFGENAKFGPLGVGFALAGVAALGGAIATMSSKAGDVMSPAKGKTMISTKEGGLFELSPNDDVVAAPGAAAALAGGGGSSAKLEQLQSQTNALLRQVLSKQGTVSLDAEKMGTAISMNTYEISP